MKHCLSAIALGAGLGTASLLTGIAVLGVTGSPWAMLAVVAACSAWSAREVFRAYGCDRWWLHPGRTALWLATWPVSAGETAFRWLRGFCRVYRHCVANKWWPAYKGGRGPDIADLSEWEMAWSKVLDKGYQDAGTVAPEPRYERRPR